ncbi:uncharacterized protein LOC110630484 [Manihot esculenta]|uniref:uncharacterized protein LOC110630484 n=1 Tax=Manihot esculenta TaxID=3983 RepID=UPI001CC7591E|nr:uncharacterized protein LOC110630484 [Manihot esculenta]
MNRTKLSMNVSSVISMSPSTGSSSIWRNWWTYWAWQGAARGCRYWCAAARGTSSTPSAPSFLISLAFLSLLWYSIFFRVPSGSIDFKVQHRDHVSIVGHYSRVDDWLFEMSAYNIISLPSSFSTL